MTMTLKMAISSILSISVQTKNVHLVVDSNESILLKSTKNAYTEPSFIDKGKKLLHNLIVSINERQTIYCAKDFANIVLPLPFAPATI